MSVMYGLSKNQIASAINLAMLIECNTVPVSSVIQFFQQNQDLALKVMSFWSQFNDMTKDVFNLVLCETAKQHLKNCINLEATGYPEIEN